MKVTLAKILLVYEYLLRVSILHYLSAKLTYLLENIDIKGFIQTTEEL